MSQRKRHRDSDLNQSQSTSRTQTQVLTSANELNNMIDACLRYILNASQNWSTIKRLDIIKNALNGQNKLFNQVLEKVKPIMQECYGLKIEEVQTNKSNAPQEYFLVRDCDTPYNNGLELRDDQKHTLIIRHLILVHIHMCGGSCSNESLASFLKELDIQDEGVDPNFGNVKKLLVDFAKQNYIISRTSSDGRIEYCLGSRTLVEFKTEDFEKMVERFQNNPVETVLETEDEEMDPENDEIDLTQGTE